MAPTNEAGVIRSIVKAIKDNYPDAWIFKTHGGGMQMAGVPDLLVTIDGKTIALEAKHQRPGATREGTLSRVTTLQKHHLEALSKAGAVAEVVVSAAEALEAIQSAGISPRR